MLDVPLSSEIDGHVLQVPVTEATAKVINDVMNSLHEEIEVRCATKGVNINAVLVPTWYRVVELDELDMIVDGSRALAEEAA
ncbi:hypothetical protein [Curtobacterium sp. MCLR17_034]|uniref:hypothetical protein n=1 Tax=Curtobacterium sp. MCLR17_034 TaxID=2175623 RepID=UPI0011B8523A|nr:hypothetical protein [Curtobacterium sp. MCLR17_034]